MLLTESLITKYKKLLNGSKRKLADRFQQGYKRPLSSSIKNIQ